MKTAFLYPLVSGGKLIVTQCETLTKSILKFRETLLNTLLHGVKIIVPEMGNNGGLI